MKQVTIDCSAIQNSSELHAALKAALSFPEWYGGNLDALHDCLSAITEETELVLENFLGLDGFAKGFARVFADTALENPSLTITLC